jgi:predicted GIY-YIG superfamily endonuclease
MPAEAGIHANRRDALNDSVAARHRRRHGSDRAAADEVSGVKLPCVYILASRRHGTLYIGVTSSLARRMSEHEQGLIDGFTKQYGVVRLVYFETHQDMDAAIRREKRLKA